MFSDISIIRGVIKTAKHLAETSDEPIFLYRFSIPKHHAEKYSSKNLKGRNNVVDYSPHSNDLFDIEILFLFQVQLTEMNYHTFSKWTTTITKNLSGSL